MPSFHFPFKTLLVMGVLSFVLVDYPPLRVRLVTNKEDVKKAEFYPLSSFPMYSTFSESPFLAYITDAAGEKVAIDTSLKSHASELKKTYERCLKDLKKQARVGGKITDLPMTIKAEAGRTTLELLKAKPTVQEYLATRPDKRLQLHEIILTQGPDGIERRGQLIAEL